MRHTKILLTMVTLLACTLAAHTAAAQCMLANPSFEVAGSAGAVFAGWNQFGPVGFSTSAMHGFRSARVTGPNAGGFDVAAYWQSLDCVPGRRWTASVNVLHSTASPLMGQSQAILNIEWRDAGGSLISYESHTAANAATPRVGPLLQRRIGRHGQAT